MFRTVGILLILDSHVLWEGRHADRLVVFTERAPYQMEMRISGAERAREHDRAVLKHPLKRT